NVIEQIFGILKQQFIILNHPPYGSMEVQARIPPALAAIHNFICIHDPNKICNFNQFDPEDPDPGYYGKLAHGPANQRERNRASERYDQTAQMMCQRYIHYKTNVLHT
ncbi:hypothetical protein JAAARDRAFT_138590, partial [Jaapia argillacea MUCL 33604]